MLVDIDKLYYMLSWDRDEKVQEKGRAIAGKLKYLSVFLQPVEDKSVWENCAKILQKKVNPNLSRIFLNYYLGCKTSIGLELL